ncbi:MAG: DNA polymerase III subunit delta [Candidatus Krumholzibacteria bacterium]|nr:DNA polymerase III subunit delta [Candidatus Krumholzibacteria bacterium]MDH4338407.1 DNA polymerase III subunit delta [Candidatus Krumholzibacteria bacterium]MDH5269085.1 DNA polymerase III subunit delta [Candidatus Krumholzibacteria bacterium]MDH5627085.1 DNA polymerase III subunit delta [Candidatus Krumholzibacteria bacterium]
MAPRLQGYKKLFEDVRQGRLKPVYFLHGPEEFMKKEFVRELLQAALPGGDRTFNLDIVYGDEFDPQAFDDRVQSFPLFSSRRVLILKNFEALSTANRERVIDRVERVPDSLTLVIESSSAKLETQAHKRLGAVAGARGVAFAFDTLDENETLERVLARFRREKVQVDADALDLLIESVGTQLIDIANEVDKILLSVPADGRVTRDTVASVVGRYRTDSLFSVLDAVGATAPATLVPRVATLLEAGEEPVFVVAMMLRRVVSLLEVQTLLGERGRAVSSDRVLAAELGATNSPFYAGKLREQAVRVPRERLDALLANLRWADTRLKSTSLPGRVLIEEALIAAHVGKTLATPSLSP